MTTLDRQLESGCCRLRVTNGRATITLHQEDAIWTTLSSAVLNGGLQSFVQTLQIINANVPADYDGVTPNPVALLRLFAQEEDCLGKGAAAAEHSIGLLTAASIQSTLRVATRSADGVVVDAVVTAGISNARRAGADADYFQFNNDSDTPSASSSTPPPGTINTVVITNASLTPAALVETYAIVIEAKCAACADLYLSCPKSGGQLAQGTGTDCAVIVTHTTANNNNTTVQHAGKHTLFAELVGQAVYEATREALLTNIHHLHNGSWTLYTLQRWKKQLVTALCGARPCVPPRPMMAVPRAPFSVILVGIVFVIMSYSLPVPFLSTQKNQASARVMLAVAAWDRCLGEPPLCIHPVVLVGRFISVVLDHVPQRVLNNPLLGLCGGTVLLLFLLVVSMTSTHCLFAFAASASKAILHAVASHQSTGLVRATEFLTRFLVFLLEVVLVKSTCSLQLLCTISLQMAKFLERRQLDEARSQLSWLCSRDAADLSAPELAGATLESLSENLSDGLVAPLFWYTLAGGRPVGAMGYRVVNTLDSRIGYRGKYEWFGKPSARLDDVLNWVPARITALLLAIGAIAVPGCCAANGLKVAWTDCSQCESPNAGWPMSAMAGLLGVRLEKKGEYSLGGGSTKANNSQPGVVSIRLGQRVAQLAGGLAIVVAVMVCCNISTWSAPYGDTT